MKPRTILAGSIILGVGTSAPALAGGVVSVDVIAAVGQSPPGAPKGSTVATLNAPFTDGDGNVGFTGNLSPSNNFVWYDTGIIWLNSDGLPGYTITGAEGTMGVSNNGGFIYAPTVNGGDAVWGSDGLLLNEGDAAPGFPGMFSSFNSRPTLTPFNVGHWVGGVALTAGGAANQRALYRRTADSGSIAPILKTGDMVGGLTISSPSGIEFDYDVSDNVKHVIVICDTTAATSADQIVYLDGSIALREGDLTAPAGDAWAAFDIVGVNSAGNWIVTGDTNGPTASDEFVAYNGEIKVREGNTLDGVLLGSGWTLRAASINNLDGVAHMWGLSATEVLFVGDGPTLGTSSLRVLGTGDLIDIDGDSAGDVTVTDFEASAVISPGLSFSDHDYIYVEVTLSDGVNPEYEAIIRVPLPQEPCPEDINGDSTVNVLDLLALIAAWGSPGGPADINGDSIVNVLDLLIVIAAWGAC